jgi:iron complex outermembrane receptor protein
MKQGLSLIFSFFILTTAMHAQNEQAANAERQIEKLSDNSFRVVINISDNNTSGLSKVLEVFPAGSSYRVIASDSAIVTENDQSLKFVWLNRKQKSIRLEYTLQTNGASWEGIIGQYTHKDDLSEYSYFIQGKLTNEIKEPEVKQIVSGKTVKVTGIVRELATGEPLIGAIISAGSTGTTTDIDGQFELLLDKEQTITVSFIGMESIVLSSSDFQENSKLQIELNPNITLKEVTVISDMAVGRRTPVAFSDISSIKIKEELASRDLPMILNTTPGVYATQSGGGDGDARVNIRGFNQRNVSVMVDGIPMNDMENGWVYWSNWFGLDNVTQKTQVQRGLGASKLAVPSIGGNINILTQGMDEKFNVKLSSELGNNNMMRQGFGINSGRLRGGWGITAAFSYRTNDGWVEQLNSEQMFYFLKVQKQFEKHSFSISAMGSPQEHEQRLGRNRLSFYDVDYALKQGVDTAGSFSQKVPLDRGLRFNSEWGYLSRNRYDADAPVEVQSGRNNYYHKPIVNFKHFWTPNEKFALSNVLYASFGNGGGMRPNTTQFDDDGHIDFQYMYDKNTKTITNFLGVVITPANLSYINDKNKYAASYFLQSSINNHKWYGLLSTFKSEINKQLEISGGLDVRYYTVDRYQIVYDLLGADYALIDKKSGETRYIQDQNIAAEYNNPAKAKVVRYEGDRINYNITSNVLQSGVFTLAEYSGDSYTAFLNITTSNTRYNRIDHFALRDSSGNEIESGWKNFNGGTAKAGFNYRFNKRASVFMNTGFLSRAPMLANTYYSTSLETFSNLKNEEISSAEVGANYNTKEIKITLNAYYTVWNNRPVTGTRTNGTENFYYNVPGMRALHQGVELDAEWNATKSWSMEGVLSVGDWRWKSAATAYVTDENGNTVGDPIQFDARNIRVGDAAQFQTSYAVRYSPFKGFYFKPRITYFDNNFADFNPDGLSGENAGKQSWKMPAYHTIDISLGYGRDISKDYNLALRINILNVTDQVFVTDALNNEFRPQNNPGFNATSAGVYYGMGLRWTAGLTLTIR